MDDIDADFEPQDRPRSCTWPSLRRPEFLDKKPSQAGADQQAQAAQQAQLPEEAQSQAVASPQITPESKVDLTTPTTQRKNGSRRNAWGNLSYADLITKAIQGAPEQRLTLAQIYEWMVKNVPFFKDKGDSNSSAGWKNSIRHNLSLHSRFVRVQNEGTGKSSWWMINPDAKPGKNSRRRSSSMDTSNAKWEKKRGRAKKKAEEKAKNCYPNSSPKLEGADDQNSLAFSLSTDFRSRASSNASSCGRLTPIMANELTDMHDSEAPPMSPVPFVDHIGPPHHSFGDSQDSNHTAELTSLAKAMSLNSAMNSPLNPDQMEQLTVPGYHVSPQNNGGHYHSSGTSNGNGYIYSPSSSQYSGSELSPAQNGVQSPFSSYSQPNTPVMSPINQPQPQQQQQCSPINGVSDLNPQYIQQPPGLLSQSANILSQDPIQNRLNVPADSVMMQQAVHNQSMLSSCREQSNMVHRQRFVSPGQHQQVNQSSLALALGMSQQGFTPASLQMSRNIQAYQQQSTQQNLQSQLVPNGPIPNDLVSIEVEPEFDIDMDSFIRNEVNLGDGFNNVNFDNINTGNPTSTANIGTNWVH